MCDMDIWPQNVVQTKESEVEVAGSGGASQSAKRSRGSSFGATVVVKTKKKRRISHYMKGLRSVRS